MDFEELVRDLLQVELGVRLETFASGPDRGIDLRYFCRGTGAATGAAAENRAHPQPQPRQLPQAEHHHGRILEDARRDAERSHQVTLETMRQLAKMKSSGGE